MITEVEKYEKVRRKILIDGVSQNTVSKELHHSKKTIRKMLEHPVPPEFNRTEPHKRHVVGPFEDIIKSWLETDKKIHKKQRHNAQKVFDRLKDEYEFTGSYSAIKRFIRSLKKAQSEVFVPIKFDPGEEAQVDWGEVRYIQNGQEKKGQLFCMRLCSSLAPFVRIYPSQSQECFLDGHVKAFEYFGGVPKRLAYDNLKTAVIQVGTGKKRTLNSKFIELKSYYLFDTRFCQVAKGNEKGHVENLVKLSELRFMTPLPQVVDFEELNTKLLDDCKKYLNSSIHRSKKTCLELFKEEKEFFLPLPKYPFQACMSRSTIVSKFSTVRYANNDYSTPVEYAHKSAVVRGYVDKVTISVEGKEISSHKRSYKEGDYVLEPWHYIPILETKPGLIDSGRPFKGFDWGAGFDTMRKELECRYELEGTRKFIRILLLFSEFSVKDVQEAVRKCVALKSFDDEAVKTVLTHKKRRPHSILDLSDYPGFQDVDSGIRSSKIYDAFLSEGGVV